MLSFFGHSASQARVLVQLPKPSSSIFMIMALARRAASGRPCGSKANWLTLELTNSMAEPFLQAATQQPQPIQAALAQDVVLQQNLSQIDREQAEKMAEIDLQRSQLDTEYRNAIADAQATGNAELANALYEEYVRQQNQAIKQTAAATATTPAKPILTASQYLSYPFLPVSAF